MYNANLTHRWYVIIAAVCATPCVVLGVNMQDIYRLGIYYHETGRFDESIACFKQFKQLRFGDNLMQLHALRSMDWERAQEFLQPYWWYDYDIAGKRIFIKHDGGAGDAVQFLRYAKYLHEAGAYVIVETPPSLREIYKRVPSIDECVSYGSVPKADITFTVATPVLTLTMHETLSAPSSDVPYIFADPALVEEWKERLAGLPGPKIGLCWCSSPLVNSHTGEKSQSPRSIPLEMFEEILTTIPGTFISLQGGYGTEQLKNTELPLIYFPDLDTKHGRFADTMAIMKNLDLIITVDTSIAHIAGALGVQVWTILPMCSDFRWFSDRSDSPWYPTLRLFRQQSDEDWQPVVGAVLDALQHEGWHE